MGICLLWYFFRNGLSLEDTFQFSKNEPDKSLGKKTGRLNQFGLSRRESENSQSTNELLSTLPLSSLS